MAPAQYLDQTGDCKTCKYHKGMTNKEKGVRIPGEYGKCIRPLGVCPQVGIRTQPADARKVTVLPSVKPLSVREENRRAELEAIVIRNFQTFYEVGCALREIHDTKLYRTTHQTFEKYCRDLFDIAQSRSYQLIDAANIIDNIKSSTIVELSEAESDEKPAETDQISTIPLPSNEAQARVLAKIPPEQQPEIWKKAVESAPDGHVTALHIKRMIGATNRAAVKEAVEKAEKETAELVVLEKFDEEFRLAMVAMIRHVERERRSNWKTTDRAVVLRTLRTLYDLVNRED